MSNIINDPSGGSVDGGGAKPIGLPTIDWGIKDGRTNAVQPVIKQLQSKEEVANRMNEEIAKIKFPLKTTVITSAVPLGLAYYSYYNNYSLKKGVVVVVIGSAVALYGAIALSFSLKK